LKDTVKPEGVLDTTTNQAFFEGIGGVSVAGPYSANGSGDTASRHNIFICYPSSSKDGEAQARQRSAVSEETCPSKIITNVANLAYRRRINADEIPALLAPYKAARNNGNGGSFEDGIRMALQRILVSPYFIFRIETDPEGIVSGGAYRVSDVELASR